MAIHPWIAQGVEHALSNHSDAAPASRLPTATI